MRQNRTPGRAARRRAQDRADHRHCSQQLHGTLVSVHAGEYGVAAPLGRGHCAAGAVDQVDQRNAIARSQVLDESTLAALAPVAAPAGPAAHGKILASHCDRPPFDTGQAHYIRGRRYLGDLAIHISGVTGQFADFLERTRVHQAANSLAHGKPSLPVVPGDGLLPPPCSAHLRRSAISSASGNQVISLPSISWTYNSAAMPA